MSKENFRWLLVTIVFITGFYAGFQLGDDAKHYFFGFLLGSMAGVFLGVVLEMGKE